MQAWPEGAKQDADDDGSAGQAELHGCGDAGDGDGERSEYEPEYYAYEYDDQVGFVEAPHGVAEHLLDVVNGGGFAHHGEAIAELEDQIGRGQQLHTGAVDAADVDAVVVA